MDEMELLLAPVPSEALVRVSSPRGVAGPAPHARKNDAALVRAIITNTDSGSTESSTPPTSTVGARKYGVFLLSSPRWVAVARWSLSRALHRDIHGGMRSHAPCASPRWGRKWIGRITQPTILFDPTDRFRFSDECRHHSWRQPGSQFFDREAVGAMDHAKGSV